MIKKHLLFLHGAWHASRCFERVLPFLNDEYNVSCLNLPGHDEPRETFLGISLQTYVDFLVEKVHSHNVPVTLVGHSFAGVVMSEVAERIPEFIEKLIYIAAYIPEHGKSMTQSAEEANSAAIAAEFCLDLKRNSVTLQPSNRLQKLLYHDCNAEDRCYAMAQLQSEPLRPLTEPVHLTNERFGRVKKVYIECIQDRVILPAVQKQMVKINHCLHLQINAGHTPFLSAPEELAKMITKSMSL